MKDIVMREIGNAFEILYNLDIKLSKHFVGIPDHPNDTGSGGGSASNSASVSCTAF